MQDGRSRSRIQHLVSRIQKLCSRIWDYGIGVQNCSYIILDVGARIWAKGSRIQEKCNNCLDKVDDENKEGGLFWLTTSLEGKRKAANFLSKQRRLRPKSVGSRYSLAPSVSDAAKGSSRMKMSFIQTIGEKVFSPTILLQNGLVQELANIQLPKTLWVSSYFRTWYWTFISGSPQGLLIVLDLFGILDFD